MARTKGRGAMGEMNDATARATLVRELDVIGGDPAERFDRVTRLARDLFGVPMAYLNVIDDAILHTLTPTTPTSPRQIPIEESFCARVVLQDEPITVTDTLADQRFSDLSTVLAIGIRAYAGAPVYVRGTRIGAVCVMDTQPRAFSNEDLVLLQDLATWAGRILSASINDTAPTLLTSAFQPDPLELPGYRLTADAIAFDGVSGDFYDWTRTGQGAAFTLADVMGKGPVAAALAASVRSAFRSHLSLDSAAAVMSVTDRQVTPDMVRAESFATAFHAHVDIGTGWVEFADAGHGIAMVVSASAQRPRVLRSRDLPLGLHLGTLRRTSSAVILEPGDALIVCSDGVLDLFDGTLLSLDRLAEMYKASPAGFLTAVRACVVERGADDDVTTLVLQRRS